MGLTLGHLLPLWLHLKGDARQQVVGSALVEMQGELQGLFGDDMELWAGACPLLGSHS